MSKRRRVPVPDSPRVYTVAVRGRRVAEVTLETGGGILGVAWVADVSAVAGADRERSIADLVRRAGLDPKLDHDRLFEAVFAHAPKRE